jgi:hypothetical protein
MHGVNSYLDQAANNAMLDLITFYEITRTHKAVDEWQNRRANGQP